MLHASAADYDEDLAHMLLECPAFIHQRKPLYSEIKTQVINCIGAHKWRELFNSRDKLVKLLLDCSRYSIIKDRKCLEIRARTSRHRV